MVERDIWTAANEMMKLFGDEAAIHAAMRADAMCANGDDQGYSVWKRVLAAIIELRSTEPRGASN